MTFSYGVWNDLQKALPIIRQLLGAEDLQILGYGVLPLNHIDEPEIRDRKIKLVGIDGLPYIHSRTDQMVRGKGISLYESRFVPGLRYCIVKVPDYTGCDVWHIVVPTGKVYQLKRAYIRASKMSAASRQKPPLLPEGVLDDIVKNSIGFLLKDKLLKQYNVNIKRGILLSGDPGNGKTMVCRYLRKLCLENNIDFDTVDGAEIERRFAEGEGLVDLFTRATVTVFDDIDISLLNRKGRGDIACSILSAMCGLAVESNNVIRIFTTNEDIKDLDEAFLRPGRIDRIYPIGPPDADLRQRFVLEYWHEDIRGYLEDNQLLESLIERTHGFSYADLDSVRTFLAMNKIMDGEWNLDKALANFTQRRADIPAPARVGFGGNGVKKNRMTLVPARDF